MTLRIAFVDDEPNTLKTLQRVFLDEPYEVLTFLNPGEALEALDKDCGIAVITSDLRMPEMDGAAFLEEARKRCPECVRMIMTGYGDLDAAISAINQGKVYRFISKPWDSLELIQAVKNAVNKHELQIERKRLLAVTRRQNVELQKLNKDLEKRVCARTEEIRENEAQLRKTLDKLRSTMGGIIEAMAITVETRDPYTAGHQRRVADLARAIADDMGLSGDKIDGIRMAGIIHDLGKISIPSEILNKPGGLSRAEFALIKPHPVTGYNILKDIDFPWPVAEIVRQHHERLDGSGYPDGLSGDQILVEARVLAVADTVEAMASHRPYRPALGIDAALEEISSKRESRLDPEAVDAVIRLFTRKGFGRRWERQIFHG